MVTLMHGDCLELMKDIPDGSVDMVLCDLPYGTTISRWDVVIPLEPLWRLYHRVCKPDAAILLFGAEPFSSSLRLSNIDEFRYDWIWEKTKAPNFMFVKQQPRRLHETISVFYSRKPVYNPQMEAGAPYKDKRTSRVSVREDCVSTLMGQTKKKPIVNKGERFPSTVIRFSNVLKETYHPTQKPADLLEYLIKTYTNPGHVVLDNTMGSGSTGVACVNTGRDFIGIELDDDYFAIAQKRIADAEREKSEQLFSHDS